MLSPKQMKKMSPANKPHRGWGKHSSAFSNRMIGDIVFGICLVCVIGFLTFTIDLSKQNTRENRESESFPTIFNENGINKNFSAGVEKYISDHLSARDKMIDGYFAVLSAFDRRGNKQVFIGKDGWLFGNFVGNSHNFEMLSYYQRKVGFSVRHLEKIKADLKRLSDWAEARDIKLYVYFPPDKQTIYKEYYPSFITLPDEPTLVTEVEEYLKGSINIISLEDAFLKHRHQDLLYYKTESHWTPAGAYLAYRLIMQRLGQDFDALKPLGEQDIRVTKTAEVISCVETGGYRRAYKGNLYNMLGKPSYIDVHEPLYKKYTFKNQAQIKTDSVPPFETSLNPNGQALKIYLIGDSYSDYIIPFLSATFKEVRKVRINQGEWGIRFDSRASDVENFKPDILLLGISDLKMIELLKIW